ncbi:MAG: hypothetical protein ABI995_12465, partial [Acidobacteriota bacterium]
MNLSVPGTFLMTFRVILLASFAALALAITPSPAALIIRNAATNSSSSVAPGSFLAISTTGFLPLAFSSAAGYSVELRTSDQRITRLTPIFPPDLEANGQSISLWVAIPSNAPLGDGTVALLNGGADVTPGADAEIHLVAAAPGLFTKNYKGYGPALALNHDATPNALTNAAIPGKSIALFGTGLRDAGTSDVTVELAGRSVATEYAGPQGLAGLDQVNFRIPSDAFLGCYVPVAIRVRGVISNQAVIAVNPDASACAHPLGLSYSDLRTLDAGGIVPLARFSNFHNEAAGEFPSDFSALTFLRPNAGLMYEQAGPQMPDSLYFGCQPQPQPSGNPIPVDNLDVGPAVTLAGPGGRTILLEGFYSNP